MDTIAMEREAQIRANDAKIMIGGPGMGDSGSHNQDMNMAQTGKTFTETPVETPKKKIFVGTKEFSDEQELAKYTQQLQERMAEIQLNQPPKAVIEANKPKISDLMFSDPDAYTEALQQQAEERAYSRVAAENNKKEAWNKFWVENKDLAEFEDLVQAKVAQRAEDYKNLSAEEGFSKIALEVRNTISKIKGTPISGKELSSSPAVVAGSSNGFTTTQVAAKPAPRTFVEQMLAARQKKGKS